MEAIANSLGLPAFAGALLQLISSLLLALFADWIAVRLSRDKFRSERWWERKVQAYERVIDAFHKAKKF
jgi:hypothetical protein